MWGGRTLAVDETIIKLHTHLFTGRIGVSCVSPGILVYVHETLPVMLLAKPRRVLYREQMTNKKHGL